LRTCRDKSEENLPQDLVTQQMPNYRSADLNLSTLHDDEACGRFLALVATVRKIDVVCRYGGEKFCILLPQTGPDKLFMWLTSYGRAVKNGQFQAFPER